jgi:hypothetical protein
MANERVFNLTIGGIDVSQYIDNEDLTEISQVAEDGIWNYKVDSVSVILDKTVLDVFGLDEFTIEGLYKKLVNLQYYGNDILGGIVGEVSYNFDDEELDIEIYSYGKVVNEIDIPGVFENFWPGGDEFHLIIHSFLWKINDQLEALDYPFKLFNQVDNNPINRIDFPFFRSLNSETLRIRDFANIAVGNPRGVYQRYDRLNNIFYDEFYVFYSRIGGNSGYVGYRLTEDGIDVNDDRTLTGQNATLAFLLYYRLAEEWEDDSGIEDYLLATYQFDKSSPTFRGKAKVGEVYYTVVEGDLFRIFHEQTDDFIFKYEDENAGQIQKDFAILTNSITWIGPDRKMYYQLRTGGTGIKNPKNAISLEYEMVDEKDNLLEFPEGIIISDVVKGDLNDYYQDYLRGIFHVYTSEIDVGEFDSSEFPLILKNLKVKARGKSVDLGVIVSIDYAEDTLEIESQKRIPGS